MGAAPKVKERNCAAVESAKSRITSLIGASIAVLSANRRSAACSAGWYTSSPVAIALTGSDGGAGVQRIVYTTDGSEPYQQGGRAPTGTVYSQPIRIAKTACLRAVAVKQGWTSSPLQTQTYLFPANVLLQSARPPGFPTDWKGRATD